LRQEGGTRKTPEGFATSVRDRAGPPAFVPPIARPAARRLRCAGALRSALMDIPVEDAKRELESRHGCSAEFFYTSRVQLFLAHDQMWGGRVHVFIVSGHTSANEASVWGQRRPDSTVPIHAVLHVGDVSTAADAVRVVHQK
jgi:hypothetical protein